MIELKDSHKSVLECYSRPVVHMRRQVSTRRFGLVFGAGLCKKFGIPTWTRLVRLLAKDPNVKGEKILQMVPPRTGPPYRTEMLFEHFRQKEYDKKLQGQHHTRQLDYEIGAKWRMIIRSHLYSKVKAEKSTSLRKHPYLNQYLPLIQHSHMTVTYNFDDIIEQCLQKSRPKGEKSTSLGFESITNPWTQFRRANAIIYHPNGVVPQSALETPSDRFIFSEASYAEQLMGIFAGDQAGLVHHFSKHTCLLIGLSLEDETLRNVLMQGARSSPGNFHYYVYYLRPGKTLDQEKQRAIRLANFKVYNLITLFLGDDGIRALAELINVQECPTNQFCDFACEHNIPVKFNYYITGPLGVGKSTNSNNFRNLVVLDEWLEQRPKILAKDWERLTENQRKSADKWITDQFRKKNDLLRNEREGIFICDRGPLDPLSFTQKGKWKSKARMLLNTLCPGEAQWQVEDGRVILLKGEGTELWLRMILTKREGYSAEKLEKMETWLGKVYGMKGVVRFDTRGLTVSDVTRRVAEIVHLEDYAPTCDLHKRLKAIRSKG